MDKDMYSQTRLLNRNNNYYYRAKIPLDLQDHFGKKERKFSLKTKDRAQAAALVRKFAVEEDEEFARLRALKNQKFQTITRIDNEFIQDLCKRYHYAVMQGDENLRKDKESRGILESYMDQRTDLMSDLRKALAFGDSDKIKPALSVFLFLNKIILDCSEANYEELSYEFLKTLTLTHEKQFERDNGQVVETPPEPLVSALLSDNPITWEVLVDKWVNRVMDRPETTVDAVTKAVLEFERFLNHKKPAQITKTDVEAFRDHLFVEVKNSYGTVLKKIRFISSVFQVSIDSEILANNPVAKINFEKPRKRDCRQPYNFDDLNFIFRSPIYSDNKRPKGGGGEAAAWLQGHERLFPNLRPDCKGKISGNWSKWWGRYARKTIGISDKSKVFHSLRHAFRDACREAELTEELCDSLMGHTSNKMGRSYGAGFSLVSLQTAIEKIDFPIALPVMAKYF